MLILCNCIIELINKNVRKYLSLTRVWDEPWSWRSDSLYDWNIAVRDAVNVGGK